MIKMFLQENAVIEDGFSLKWIEGEDLEVDFHNKLISLNCKDKNQLPTKDSQLAAK